MPSIRKRGVTDPPSEGKQSTKDLVKAVVEETTKDPGRKRRVYTKDELFPTGSTLLNLALSDSPFGGFCKGTLVNIIGDSSSGKSFLLWTLFAEVCRDSRFSKYDLDYDEPESALNFDVPYLFGERTDKKVFRDDDARSDTVRNAHRRVDDHIKSKRPFIYGLDSLDALTTEEEKKLDIEKTGYGSGVPKQISKMLRMITGGVKDSDSLIVVISQTRDDITAMFGEKKTRSGGKALKFYASHEIWLAVVNRIQKGPEKNKKDIGVLVRVRIKKNKLTGKRRDVEFPIYYDYGIDDVGSCVDFLVHEGFWAYQKEGKMRSEVINTASDFINATRDELIKHIEANGEEAKLRAIVAESWADIEKNLASNRKPKY